MKHNRFKLSAIGLKYGVSSNAVRKALQRHSPIYMNIKNKDECKLSQTPLTVSQEYFLEDAVKNNILIKKNNEYFYKNRPVTDIYESIMLVNGERIKSGLPIYRVRTN